MDKKATFDLATIKRISIITDILIPVMLYYALTNQLNPIAWVFLGIIMLIRLALVFVTR